MSQKSLVAQAVAENCGNDIVAAVVATNGMINKWEKAARSLFKQGARAEMLRRKPRGDQFDESLENVVESFIIQAMNAGKPFRFGIITLTFAEVISLTREQLREYDDKVISATKIDCIRTVASRYGLMVRHLDKFQNPGIVRERGTKNDKAEIKTETTDPIVLIQGLLAKKTLLVDVADVDRFENAGLEMVALMRKHRK